MPIKLVLPVTDNNEDFRSIGNHQQQQQQQQETGKKVSVKDLLEKGAGKISPKASFNIYFRHFILACNVLYLNNVDVDSLSGQIAVNKALRSTFDNADRLQATVVHFKVSSTGITLTDTKKK